MKKKSGIVRRISCPFAKSGLNFRILAKQAALLGDEKLGGDIVILDVRAVSSVTDYLVIISVYSHPQLEAVCRHISDKLKQLNVLPLRKEGGRDSSWVVLDFGGVLVHVMLKEYRDFYKLEKLWFDTRKVSWKKAQNVKRKN